MSFKTLLCAVQPTEPGLRALTRTVALAVALDADLIGVGARAPIYLADPWIISGDIVQRLADDDAEQLNAAERAFEAATRALGPRAHWRRHQDFPNTVLNRAAAGADLIVAYPERGPDNATVRLSELVLEAGVPVLVLPSAAPEIRTSVVMVAWRNTADARRALTAALPLLKAAHAVSLVQVVRREDADDAWIGVQAARDRLRRHGVDARADLVLQDDAADADVLLGEADARAADIIVLGGYGHSRAREWILGGVTHDLLTASTRPLLMVH